MSIKCIRLTLSRRTTWSSKAVEWSLSICREQDKGSRGWIPSSNLLYIITHKLPEEKLWYLFSYNGDGCWHRWFQTIKYNSYKWVGAHRIFCGERSGCITGAWRDLSVSYNGFTYSVRRRFMYSHKEKVSSDSLRMAITARDVRMSLIYLWQFMSDLISFRSFSLLPMSVPNWQLWRWSCSVSRKRSLNWNRWGFCASSCHTQSRNWRKTGLCSLEKSLTIALTAELGVMAGLLPPADWKGRRWPARSENLWPNASQSFSIKAWKEGHT